MKKVVMSIAEYRDGCDVAHALLRAAPRLLSALAGSWGKGRDESRPGRLKPAPRLRGLLIVGLATALSAVAQYRTNPPTVLETTPPAVTRGNSTDVRVEGINLRGAHQVVFDNPGVAGVVKHVNELGDFTENRSGQRPSINVGGFPPRNQVTLEVTVDAGAQTGPYRYRLVTAEGSTNTGTLVVEPYYGEVPEIEPNEAIPEAMLQTEYVFLPAIVAGTIRAPGDEDFFTFRATGGREVVFEMTAQVIGSALRWGMDLYDAQGKPLASRRVDDSKPGTALAWVMPADGRYTLRVHDVERGGSRRHTYRVKIGEFPYLTGAWPLGVRKGAATEVSFYGFNLGDQRRTSVEGKPGFEQTPAQEVTLKAARGVTHNKIRMAVGEYQEAAEQGETTRQAPQEMPVPSTMNGRIRGRETGPDQDYYRFRARKGAQYVVEVEAQRFGSPLDSVVEVLDAAAKPIPRATVRAIQATALTLADRDSASPGLRLLSADGLAVGDYVRIGNEILRIEALPRGPDDDFRFDSFGGQRIGYWDTTPEAHAVDTPVHKVRVYPPGRTFAPNGLPVTTLYYRNDDGGPLQGKDSRLSFTAPADGEYLVRVRDIRGKEGEEYAYRLTVREPKPDFLLDLSPSNPNVPRGGRTALRVTAARLDGFDAPIEVTVRDLPAGVRATSGTIAPGQDSTVLILEADADAKLPKAVPLQVVGRAGAVARVASADDKLRYLALATTPDVRVETEQREVVLEAGGTAEVMVAVKREKGFDGRVPISVLNLPPGVRVLDVGLNGVLITEEETRQKFVLEAKPWVKPMEQSITLTGEVETRSFLKSFFASAPITLKIAAKRADADAAQRPGSRAGAAGAPRR